MMPRWEDVTSRMTNLVLSPTGKRVAAEARGEIFTIPAEKGDVRNLTHSSGSAERDPAWSPDGKFVSYFSDKSGEYQLVIEAQDGLTPPRAIALPKPTHYYTPSWSPDSKKLVYTDTNLKVWVLDVASGQAKVIGSDPWMVPSRTLNPVWSPDSKWVAYSSRLQSLYHAIFVSNVETGEVKQVTDGLADAVWPAWDASGKYLWFLASTDFGLKSQWLDMTSYDHEENFGLYFAVLKKGEPSPLKPESDEDHGVGTGGPATPGGGRGGRGGAAPAEGAQAETPAAPAPAPRTPVTVQIDFDGIQQRIVAVAGVPVRPYSELRAGVGGDVYYLEARDGCTGRNRQHPAPVSFERPQDRGLHERRCGLRSQRRRPQAGLHDARRRRGRPRARRRGRAPAGALGVPGGCRPAASASGAGPAQFRTAHVSRADRKSSSRSSTRAGATSAITSTFPTCTAPTGRG